MIIIGLSGGLGNQLYQYALGENLKKRGASVKYDISFFDGYRNLKLNYLTKGIELIDTKNTDIKTQIYLRFRRTKGLCKIMRCLYTEVFKYVIIEDKNHIFKFETLDFKKAYFLEGHWGKLPYFNSQKNILQERISLRKEFYSNSFLQFKSLINNTESPVSIHIRRTDYLKPNTAKCFNNVSEGNYYNKAIDYIKKEVKNPSFFIFSDDIEWCKSNLKIENPIYIVPEKDMMDYHDFELIRECKYHINANSTFSWWAAYLNTSPDKIVIVPQQWFTKKEEQNRAEITNMIPKGWIKL